jgi:hypothetical protein
MFQGQSREERTSRNRVEKRDVSGTMYSEEGRQLKDRKGWRDISGNRVVKGYVSRNQRCDERVTYKGVRCFNERNLQENVCQGTEHVWKMFMREKELEIAQRTECEVGHFSRNREKKSNL